MSSNLHSFGRTFFKMSAALACTALITVPEAAAQAAPELSLARLDCGTNSLECCRGSQTGFAHQNDLRVGF